MITIKEKPPKSPLRDDLVKRKKDIEQILKMEVSDTCFIFETVNLPAWKTMFHTMRKKLAPDTTFTFKKSEDNKWKVWRII